MLDKYACLKKLAARRRNEIIVTTMSVSDPWARLSDDPLDFAMVESTMGQAPPFALGLALAQPRRRVILLNGDGSTLMCLGALVTIAQNPPDNFTMVITDNGTYEVVGNYPIPGAGRVNFETIARGAGFAHVHTIENDDDFDAQLPLHFEGKGAWIFVWKILRGEEPVPKPFLYVRERAARLRQALAVNQKQGISSASPSKPNRI